MIFTRPLFVFVACFRPMFLKPLAKLCFLYVFLPRMVLKLLYPVGTPWVGLSGVGVVGVLVFMF